MVKCQQNQQLSAKVSFVSTIKNPQITQGMNESMSDLGWPLLFKADLEPRHLSWKPGTKRKERRRGCYLICL